MEPQDIPRFVNDRRAEFIQRVTVVMPIADELLSQGMLHKETYSQISAARTSQEKMRDLFTALHSGGDSVKSAFYHVLERLEPHLLQDLVSSYGQEPAREGPRTQDEFYAMTKRPRGLCLIINNYDFQSRSSLENREGTQKDGEALTRVFTRMRFLVREKKDLSSSEILRVVEEFAEKDHSAYDAFVCCVLSHGEKGSILGTDGEEVQIRDLTQPFARCKSLTQKPKIFFIQACQGKKHQQDTPVQTDGYTDDDEIQEDALGSACRTMPLEDDFLIGMATVEDCVSFRQRQKGSFYIQELCKQLETGCPRRENILTILTRVNRNISQGVFRGKKQMPEPRFTLTKTLVFPWE